jgi:hypothetical protein
MPFGPKIKEDALVACQRCCCICHKFCGTKIEVAHIRAEAEGGPDTLDNAIPLCFDCHADMRSYDFKHPKGNKYSEAELRRHRDNWFERVGGNVGVVSNGAVVETDRQLYRFLLSILPWHGSIDFIRYNNFAGFAFYWSKLADLETFERACGNPAFEFADPDLEGLRATLLSHVRQFLHTLSRETFPTSGCADASSVPEEWEIEQPKRFCHAVAEIHDGAGEIVDTYGSLVRTATRKLGLLPETMLE